jgi:monothiol glutaredoxin
MSNTQQRIDDLVKNNDILLFMKGNASFPVRLLRPCHPDPQGLRRGCQVHRHRERAGRPGNPPGHQGLQPVAHHPQLYIKGEFIGGSDIMMEMYESGELQQVLAAK